MISIDELVDADIDELIENICVEIDWREYDEAIVRYIGDEIEDGELKPVERDDKLFISWNGKEHLVPLTESPADRYVTIGSIANVIKKKYEIRLLKETMEDDTHCLLVLPGKIWAKLDKRHKRWVKKNFQPLKLGKDYFGGGKVPYCS